MMKPVITILKRKNSPRQIPAISARAIEVSSSLGRLYSLEYVNVLRKVCGWPAMSEAVYRAAVAECMEASYDSIVEAHVIAWWRRMGER